MLLANLPPTLRRRPLSGLRGETWSTPELYWPNGVWQARLAEAQANHYSVPLAAYQAGSGSGVRYVNPDGTVGMIFAWQMWPLPVYTGAPATTTPQVAAWYAAGVPYTTDQSWVSPPKSVWQAYMVSLGVQSMADQQAANTGAAISAAEQACRATGGTWNAPANSCAAPAAAADTLSAQEACLAAGKSWDPAIASCKTVLATMYPVNRCSLNNANQRVQFQTTDPSGVLVLPSSQPVTRTLDCSCPSSGLDSSWNPGGIQSCGYTPPANPTSNPPVYTPPAYTPPPATTTYSPRLSFTTSRGGNQLQNGDRWTVTISGAVPNSPVSVYGVHPDGTRATNVMGQTDGQGNFSLQGTIDASSVGTWQETWYVGSQTAGSFSFSVAPASSGSFLPTPIFPPSGGTIPTGSGTPGGGGTPSGSTTPGGACDSGSLSIGSYCVPMWGLGLGALVLVMAMGKR